MRRGAIDDLAGGDRNLRRGRADRGHDPHGAGMTWIARYIPHYMAELYACQGWRIVSLGPYHGNFSMLAIMEWEE